MRLSANVDDSLEKDKKILQKKLDDFLKETIGLLNEEEVEKIAEETEFVKRKSKLTGTLFLAIFMFGVNEYGNPTLEQLIGLLTTYLEDFSISKPGLHKRISEKAVEFFEKMLSLAIELVIPESLKISVPEQFSRILIWDSTEFQLPPALAEYFAGKGGSASPAGVKIQFCYDLKAHQWFYAITSASDSDKSMESEVIEQSQLGDLVLLDLGYYKVEIFEGIERKEAYYLSRLKTDCNIYLKNCFGIFVPISLITLLVHREFEDRLEMPVFIRSKNNVFIETRLIIERLPDAAVNARLRKLHRQAHSRGKQLTARTIFLANFNFYINQWCYSIIIG